SDPANQSCPGIADARGSGVADEGSRLSFPQRRHYPSGRRILVVSVAANERLPDLEVVEESQAVPGILSCYQIHTTKSLDCPKGNIDEIPKGSGNDVELRHSGIVG